MQSEVLPLKAAVVGLGAVGKTALILRYMYSEFSNEYEPTNADSYRKIEPIDGQNVCVDILDTAGQEDFAGIRDFYLRNVEGFLLVYAINDKDSLQALSLFREQLMRLKNSENFPMIILANKCDLCGTSSVDYTSDGMELANKWKVKFIQTSAKNFVNVNHAFQEICRLILCSRVNSIEHSSSSQKNRKRKKHCTIL